MPEIVPNPSEQKYDSLFLDEDSYRNTLPDSGIEGAAIRVPEVSAADQRISADCLENFLSKDTQFKTLLDEHTIQYAASNDLDVLKQLRIDGKLNSEIQNYFMQKITEKQGLMPERVAENSENNFKRPNYKGYEKRPDLTSKEYVSLLATSMVNGSFNFDYSKSSPIVINKFGNALIGQHRAAALLALGLSYEDKWVKDNFKIEYAER